MPDLSTNILYFNTTRNKYPDNLSRYAEVCDSQHRTIDPLDCFRAGPTAGFPESFPHPDSGLITCHKMVYAKHLQGRIYSMIYFNTHFDWYLADQPLQNPTKWRYRIVEAATAQRSSPGMAHIGCSWTSKQGCRCDCDSASPLTITAAT